MPHKTPLAQAAVAKAVGILGGPVKAARTLNVNKHRHQTVQSWVRNGIPAEQCPAVESATRQLGQAVLCEEMRPDVPWSVLRTCKCQHEARAAEPDAPAAPPPAEQLLNDAALSKPGAMAQAEVSHAQ